MAVGSSSSLPAPSLAPNPVPSQTNLSNDKQVNDNRHDMFSILKAPVHTQRNASHRIAQLRYMRDDALLGPRWKFWRRRRYIIGVLAMLGFFNVYSLQVILSMTIVAMTSDRTTRLQNGTDIRIPADFSWDSRVQGLLLSSFFCGYLVAQVPGGWLAARVGGRLVMGCGVGTAALLTLMVPTLCAATATHHALMVLRMIQGLVLAGCTPSINAVWSHWAPPQERSSLATLAMSGVNLGTMATIMGSGIINDIWDWPAVYYTIGTLGVMWSVTWIYLVRDDPDQDPRISSQESNYLKEVLKQRTEPNQTVKYPWTEFVSSPAVWAIFVAHFVMDWGLFTSITQLPTFIKDTLKIDLEYIGYILATPYLMMIFVMQFTGRASDWLVEDNILSQTQVRKVFLCGSYTLNSFLMLLAGLLQDPVAATLCLVVALVVLAVSMAVVCVNHLDLSPDHASVLMGISQTLATVPGVASPVLSGYIVQHQSAEEWNIVFYLAGAMFLVGALVFLVFGSGERQSWADQQHHPSDKTQFCYTNSELSDDIPE